MARTKKKVALEEVKKEMVAVSTPRRHLHSAALEKQRASAAQNAFGKKEPELKILKVPSLKDLKDFARQEVKSSIIPKGFKSTPRKDVSIDGINIPTSYNTTTLALMVKDPYWVFAIWDLAAEDVERVRSTIKEGVDRAWLVLRVYDVTFVDFNGSNANHYFDIDIGNAVNWYVNLWNDNVCVCTEIGLKNPTGQFYPIIRSNTVQTPRVSTSWRTEQIWMEVKEKKQDVFVVGYQYDPLYETEIALIPDWTKMLYKKKRKYYITLDDVRWYYEKMMPRLHDILIAKMRGRFTKRIRILGESLWDKKRMWALIPFKWFKRIRTGASEELVETGMEGGIGASENVGASASLQIQPKQHKFFFEIWTDLIVYGRTAPDAKVCLADKKIPLRKDGTFSLRYTLPNGQLPFDFTAVSGDKLEERSISTEVNRSTFILPPVMLQGKIL